MHPALLDGALQASALLAGQDGQARLPFSWSGVEVHAAGAAALRIRIGPAGPDAVTLDAWDPAGEPVLSADSLLLRPLTPGALAPAAGRDGLYRLEWTPVPVDGPEAADPAVLDDTFLARLADGADEVPALVVWSCPTESESESGPARATPPA